MRLLFLFLILLSTLSCVSHRCPTHLYVDARQALRDTASRREQVVAIQAEARVDQRGKKGRIRGVVLMFAERPNRVRLDAVTQFGPVAILTANGNRFAFADLKEKRYLEGETCPFNIARLLGVRLSAEQATAVLLGEVLLIDEVDQAQVQIVCTSEGNYAVTLRAADGGRQQITLAVAKDDLDKEPGMQRLRVTRAELFSRSAEPIWRVSYDDYRTVSGPHVQAEMPFSVRIEQPPLNSDTLLKFRQITLNPTIPPAAFNQKPPPGILKEMVMCDE